MERILNGGEEPFDSQDFSGIHGEEQQLSGKKFHNCRFDGADFSEVCFEHCAFEKCRFHGSRFNGAVLKNCADDPKVISEMLAERTHSQVVQVIGKKIVLYKEGKDDKKRIMLPC